MSWARCWAGLAIAWAAMPEPARAWDSCARSTATPAVHTASAPERLPGAEPQTASTNLASRSVEQRLAAIENELQKQADAAKKAKADAAKRPAQRWKGRIHADYWAFPSDDPEAGLLERSDAALDPADKFAFRRVWLGVTGDLFETMTYQVEIDFAVPDAPAFRDCYFGWKELPLLGELLIGNQERPYGLDHLNSSRCHLFLERPFIVDALNQDARRFGVEAYGVSRDLAWNWRYGAFMSQDLQRTGAALEIDSGEYQPEVAARLANTAWYDESSLGRGYAHWAIAGAAVLPADGSEATTAHFQTRPEARTVARWLNTGPILAAHTYEIAGLEAVVNIGALNLGGECLRCWVQRDFAASDLEFHGGYVYLGYFLTGEHVPWDRKTGTLDRVTPFENFFLVDRCTGGCGCGLGAWQVVVRLSYADFSDRDVRGGEATALTFGLNWHWNSNARMQFNYLLGELDDRTVSTPASQGIPPGTSADYQFVGARFLVDF